MKKFVDWRLVVLCLCLLISNKSWGATYTFRSGGIGFRVISTTDLTVEVVNSARTSPSYSATNVTYKGDIVIPETVKYALNGVGTIKTYTVTNIADEAFKYGSGMPSLTIPATVSSISSTAFNGATGLETLIIEDGEEDGTQLTMASTANCPLKYVYIGRNIKKLNHAERATFGPLVKNLAACTFQGCTNPILVTIPETMTGAELL